MNSNIYDVIIVGGGPSGLTAAIYTSRAFLQTLVIAGSPPGGQLTTTTDVENFPGFPQGIQGPELVENMRKQALRFNTVIVDSNVKSISGDFNDGFVVNLESGETYRGKSVILATGASAKWLDIPSEIRLRGRGVSACATCDGFFFKDKVVAVVGAGDSAMEESLYLTKFAKKVYILVRKSRSEMKASKIMQKKAYENAKIEFLYNTQIKEVLGDSKVEGALLIDTATGAETKLDFEGLFMAIGHTPNTSFLEDFIELDERGYIKVTADTKTTVEGVFAAGDVRDHRYRQAITAAGYGCMASIDAEKFLAEHNSK